MDTMIRYQRMQKKKALLIPGTDHAAVATQARVEKDLVQSGKYQNPRQELGREKLLEIIRDYADNSKATILSQIEKMGTSCDWERLAYTFDEKRSRAVNEIFVKMYHDELIYRGSRVINWSVKGQSTCSDDELVHIERPAKLYTFRYSKDFPISIATTRPETKLGDTAVAVHPDDERYKKYIGQIFSIEIGAQKPLQIKVVGDTEVAMDFGTGALGVTPAHSMIDYDMSLRHNLALVQVIGADGKMTEEAGAVYQGLDAEEAREKFLAYLRDEDLLEKEEDIVQNVATSDRFGDVIEVVPMTQWFVDVNKKIPGKEKSLKDLMREAVTIGHGGDEKQKINITPARFEKVYLSWIDNLRDWCISRQIWWGHRIPVWYTEDQKPIAAINEVEAQQKVPNKKLIQDEDTLDTWFSSGLWTFSILGGPHETKDLKDFHPTNWMQMGSELVFFWMARMILMSTYAVNQIPFKDVYIHGILRDKDGRKFSKSLGNGIDPLAIIEKYGTDALRLGLLTGTTPGNDAKFYEEKIEGSRNFVNKLWNISRFIFSQTEEIHQVASEPQVTDKLDQAILSKFNKLVKEVTEHLDKYEFSIASVKLYQFTWTDFADSYVEIAKKQGHKDEILLYILERLLKLWHPFLPYVTEVIWRQFDTKTLLLVETWPKLEAKVDGQASLYFDGVVGVISLLRELKAENKIAPSEFPLCKIVSEQVSSEHLQLVADLARVKLSSEDIDVEPIKFWSCDIYINLKKAMSAKEKEELEKYIKNLEEKLSNDNFVKNAPAQVVEENQKKLAEAKQKLNN